MVKTANRIASNGAALDPLATLASLDPVKLAEQIADLERRRDEAVAGFQKDIDALKVLERAANIRVHGKPPRKPPGPRKKKEAIPAAPAIDATTNKQKIVHYLMINQPAKVGIIAADTGIANGSVSGTLSAYPDVFEQAPNGMGWRLKRPAKD